MSDQLNSSPLLLSSESSENNDSESFQKSKKLKISHSSFIEIPQSSSSLVSFGINQTQKKNQEAKKGEGGKEAAAVEDGERSRIVDDQKSDSEEAISQHANDHIEIIFHTISSSKAVHPSFTHQLFPNEMIPYLSREKIRSLSINVHINTFNLVHSIEILGIEDLSDRTQLQTALQVGIPPDSSFYFAENSFPQFTTASLIENVIPPVGKLIYSFTRSRSYEHPDEKDEYFLYLASYQDEHANRLLTRLEKIAMWFIETADTVDFSDPRWEILLLYQKQIVVTSNNIVQEYYTIVGYITLFTFHNPFHGDSLRVCQALVFPEKQHSGLGREMLLTVYQLAEERKTITQVTVEDPSAGFQRLRNAVDFEWYVRKYSLKEKLTTSKVGPLTSHEISNISSNSGDDRAGVAAAAETAGNTKYGDTSIVQSIAENLKIIKAQALFVKEAYEYIEMISHRQQHPRPEYSPDTAGAFHPIPSSLLTNISSAPHDLFSSHIQSILEPKDKIDSFLSSLHELVSSHPHFHDFRLAVKKNIVKNDIELKQLPKQQLQKELSIAFEEKMMKFRAILHTALRLKLIFK